VIVALLAFLSVVRLWRTRPELPRLVLAIGIGIILQAVIGGITVWLHLHPSIVGLHYLLSAALVAIAAAYVVRVYATRPRGSSCRAGTPSWRT
jgi:cytochrome c oxidase assembly protein subunit 15